MTTIDRQVEALWVGAINLTDRIGDAGNKLELLDSRGYELPRRVRKLGLLNGAARSLREAEAALLEARQID